jgi:hypothetical protein
MEAAFFVCPTPFAQRFGLTVHNPTKNVVIHLWTRQNSAERKQRNLRQLLRVRYLGPFSVLLNWLFRQRLAKNAGFAMNRVTTYLFVLGLCVPIGALADEPNSGVVALLEDDAAELLPKLTNPGGDLGEAQVENEVTFSGTSSIKVTVYQRYCNLIPGWSYRIVETPKEGEYRYLRFAWKSEGLTGIMVQLHDKTDWHIRYTAGANDFGWTTQFLSQSPPPEWQLITVDLFKDFGEREIHGIALTTFGGKTGYFDHIYLARSIEELDSIDATGLSQRRPLKFSADQIDLYWKQLSSSDASVAYRAFWSLAAGDGSVREFLSAKLGGTVANADAAMISKWLVQLDDDEYDVREQATSNLSNHFEIARPQIEAEFARTTAPEVRARLATILMASQRAITEAEQAEQKAKRILKVLKDRDSK